MRLGASAATMAFSLFVLVSGNLHAQEDGRMRGEDWPMYGRNLSHTFSNEHSGINPSNVSSLQPAWTFTPTLEKADAFSASPTSWVLGCGVASVLTPATLPPLRV
jgi:glucose dehydrogenase